MNKEALRKTRNLIAECHQSYDQTIWSHQCNTPGCVAGFAAVASGAEIVRRGRDEITRVITKGGVSRMLPDAAAKFLGLNLVQRMAMFRAYPMLDRKVTANDAIRMLDHAIEYDEVRWPL